MEWDAPQHIATMDVRVTALQGSGDYHLGVEIIGTIDRLSREAVIGRPVQMLVECTFEDCSTIMEGFRCAETAPVSR